MDHILNQSTTKKERVMVNKINVGDVVKVKGARNYPLKYVTEVKADWGIEHFCWWPVVKKRDGYYVDRRQAGYTLTEKITKVLHSMSSKKKHPIQNLKV